MRHDPLISIDEISTATSTRADFELIELGAAWEAASQDLENLCAQEGEDWHLNEAVMALVKFNSALREKISCIPAQTRKGAEIKFLAAVGCIGPDPADWENDVRGATIDHLALSYILDLIRLSRAPDPVIALIEAHRAACAEQAAASAAIDALEADFPPGWLLWPTFREVSETSPDHIKGRQRRTDAIEAEEQAFDALLSTEPTTHAGQLALARYACELTNIQEGPAVEGASPAYRVLAALAGLPTRTAELS